MSRALAWAGSFTTEPPGKTHVCVCVYTYICKNIYVCVSMINEMVGGHHRLDGPEFRQLKGVGDGQEAWRAAIHGAANELDMTE